MDERQLLYFTALIDKGSFTKASKELHISQPSLSSAIKKLEENMGLTLIERTTRNISLTKEGEILYKEAKNLLNQFSHVREEMLRLKNLGPLELQIGLIESVKSWLPKVISSYIKENPDIHIQLVEVLGLKKVELALKNYKMHLAITNQYFDNKDIIMIPIYRENLVAVFPKEHSLQNTPNITLSDLKNEKFIIGKEGFQTRHDIVSAFRNSGISPNIHFEFERFETAFSLVEEGLGITIVPENYITASNHASLTIKPIADSNLSRTVYLAYMKNRYLPPVVEDFITRTKEYFKTKK